MRLKSLTSLIMALMVLGTTLVTLCPADQSGSHDIHFIAETCEGHDCERSTQSQSCEQEGCHHGLCADQPVIEEYPTQQKDQIILAPPIPFLVLNDFYIPETSANSNHASFSPPIISPQRSAVLRI